MYLISWGLTFFLRFPFSPLLPALFTSISASFRSRAALQLEILALRHQLGVLQRSGKRPKLTPADRFLWAWLCEVWNDWRSPLVLVQPATVIGWHRKGFRLFWTGKIRWGKPGRLVVPKKIRDLIRTLSRENPLWGAPCIHSELLKLGIDVGETSVSKYMIRHWRSPSQTWRTFLENHVTSMVSVDFFTVPTIAFKFSMCSWCWRTTADALCTSASRRIPPPNGPRISSGRPFRGTRRHAIYFGIGTGSSAMISSNR
jgi:hypothetical protein